MNPRQLHTVRHRLATLRAKLRDELTRLKVGSSVAKIIRGKLLALDEAIDICDQELLAEEQGAPTPTPRGALGAWYPGVLDDRR